MTWAAAAPRSSAGCTRCCGADPRWCLQGDHRSRRRPDPGVDRSSRCRGGGPLRSRRGVRRDLRGIDARIRETRKKLAVAVQATGTSLTGLYGVGPVVAAAVIGDVRDVSLRRPGPLRRLQRHRADRGVLRPAQCLPAEQAREPAAQPRHPHGRGHPDRPPAQPGPRLLRQEAGRGQDPQRGPALPETAGQQRHLRLPAGRCPAGRSPHARPGRANGERLCRQRGRLAPPGTGSSDKPLPGPVTTLRPRPATPRPTLLMPGAGLAVPRSLPPRRRRRRRSRRSASS